MAAYLIVTREEPLQDAEALAEYQRRTRLLSNTVKPLPLVIYGQVVPLEGEAPDGTIICQFDTVEIAKSWYDHPEYQEALNFRLKAAKHRAYIVEGIS